MSASLAPVVALYRACGCPKLVDSDFSGELALAEGRELVEKIRASERARFVELLVDDKEYLEFDPLPADGSMVAFKLRVFVSSADTFHHNVAALIDNAPQISSGILPTDYYLVSEDYYSQDKDQPSIVAALQKIVRLIRALNELAHYRTQRHGKNVLIFLLPDDTQTKPIELETFIAESSLTKADAIDLRLVEHLAGSDAKAQAHYTAELGVLRTTLADFVSARGDEGRKFDYLIGHWQELVATYQCNLETYISGFAFHKARHEISQAELQLAEQMATVISSIAGKIFSVPVSMVAVLAMLHTTSWIGQVLLLLGVAVASFLLLGAVMNQRDRLTHIRSAKQITLGELEARSDSYPEDLRNALVGMREGLEKADRRLSRWLYAFGAASLLPVVSGVLLILWLHCAGLTAVVFT